MLRVPSPQSPLSRTLAGAVAGLALAAMLPLHLTARPSAAPASTVDNAPQSDELAQDDDDRQAHKAGSTNYILFHDDHHTTMSGSTRDIAHAKQYKRPGEPMLWVRRSGQEYVIRELELLRQVDALWKPVGEIGDRQGKLGEQQGAIGAKQGEIGEQQGKIGEKQGEIGARQGEVGDRQGRLAAREAAASDERRSRDERAAIEVQHRELDSRMRELDQQMQALDKRMRELDAPMRDLDNQMKDLDRQMQVLDDEMQAAVRKAEAEMSAIIDRAIATGAAERVK